MVQIVWPLLVAVVGAGVYGFAANPKAAELGRILFFCGALVVTWLLAGSQFHVG